MNPNQMTQLEAQLRSWVPRPPSAALRHRLFATTGPRATASRFTRSDREAVHRVPTLRLAWLVPAAAALALFSLLATQRPHAPLSRATGSNAMLALALSNQNASASLSAALSNDQYALSPERLAATNLRSLTSTFSPRSLSGTTN
jgi:hypothetical protein